MSSTSSIKTSVKLKRDFIAAVNPAPDKTSKRTVPLSIRVTKAEKRLIEERAGSTAVSTYVRQQVLGEDAETREKRHSRKQYQPTLDSKTLAQLLGMLGQSELATSLIALALAAQSGEMMVTPELENKLSTACDDIQVMRTSLIEALNIKVEDGDL